MLVECKFKTDYKIVENTIIKDSHLVFLCEAFHSESWFNTEVFLIWWDIERREIAFRKTNIFNFDKAEQISTRNGRCFYLVDSDTIFLSIDLIDNRNGDSRYKGTHYVLIENKNKSVISRGVLKEELFENARFQSQNKCVNILSNLPNDFILVDTLGNVSVKPNDIIIIDSLGNISVSQLNRESGIDNLISYDQNQNCLIGFSKNENEKIELVRFNSETKTTSKIEIGKFSDSIFELDFPKLSGNVYQVSISVSSFDYNSKYKRIAIFKKDENKILIYNSETLELVNALPMPSHPNGKEDFGFQKLKFSSCNELLIVTAFDLYEDAAFPHFCFSLPDFEKIDFFFPESLTTIRTSNNIITIGDDRDSNLYYNEHIIYWGNTNQKKEIIMKIVCLANSFKEGGRCLAGIELDANNNPLIVNGHPKWIRPICNTRHGEVHTHLVSHINILDIIEVEITNFPDVNNYQSENVYFRENSLRVVGNYDSDKLDRLCDNHNLIFGNKGKAVSEEAIANNTFSLMFIKVNTFEVIEKTYEDNPNKSQIRLVFSFNENQYDLPVTDPVFLHRYQTNPDFLENHNQLYVSLSLAVEWKGWYYKLIAGIILSNNDDNVNVVEEDDLPF